jgi:hypothetical protein
MALAVLLEGLQAFTPDRHPDLDPALYSAGAVLTAALVAEFSMRARAPRLLTFFIAHYLRLLRPALNIVRAPLTVFGRGHLFGSALARGVAPQSPASVGLFARPVAARLGTAPLVRKHMDR